MKVYWSQQNLGEVISDATGAKADEWDGDIIVQCYGDDGELILLSMYIPVIKKIAPKVTLYLKTLSCYRNTVKESPYKWDDVIYTETPGREFFAWMNQRCHGGLQWCDNTLTVSPFRAHWWFTNDSLQENKWFIDSFSAALGVEPHIEKMWGNSGDYALFLPTPSEYRRDQLPFSLLQFNDIKHDLLQHGLELRVCSNRDILKLLKNAKFVLGWQSVLSLTTAILGNAVTVVIDDSPTKLYWEDRKQYGNQRYPSDDYLYDPRGRKEWDAARCFYVQLDSYSKKLDELAYDVTKYAIKQL
jgi:hypothetical protein